MAFCVRGNTFEARCSTARQRKPYPARADRKWSTIPRSYLASNIMYISPDLIWHCLLRRTKLNLTGSSVPKADILS
ncbi:hypothetical protein Dda3937_04534 [Dickeya dadantii 3937]|uniref:Uncharacterized protein n=1 Tax=Dickeya dadantii (strain 3937) TaxID=198628 RepID=E0SK57_DICD3|nr:hypothetical protein Dda3937_04534 [Dickeya dadantii 3937]